MNRRTFLANTSSLAALSATTALAAEIKPSRRSSSGTAPRKVSVGACMQSFWGRHPGLGPRLDQLAGIVDQMAAQAKMKYGCGLDLAVLPETCITGEAEGDALACSVPLEGPVQDVFARKAREHGCYIVVPTYLLDSKEQKLCSNAAILVGRKGEILGTYRKVHLVVSFERGNMEGGSTPGSAFPVFECDFGKLGIQICYDMEFDEGWGELARRGAELIAWPTQSPQTSQPAARARANRCYIVSSTWRHNASSSPPGRSPHRSSRRKASSSTKSISATRCCRGVQSSGTGKRFERFTARKSASITTKTRIAASSGRMIPKPRSARWCAPWVCRRSRRKGQRSGSFIGRLWLGDNEEFFGFFF